ncbi:hypothetical protein ACHAWT_003713 [Skeletonema menzelii]
MKFNSSAAIFIAACATAEASTVFPTMPSMPSMPDASDSSGGFMDNISSGGSSNFDESLGLGGSTATSGGDTGAGTAEASSPCCNISQTGGGSCPNGLQLMGGTIMDMGGIFSACCPYGGPSVLSSSTPSCEVFVPEATTAGSDNMLGDSNIDPSSATVHKMGIANLAAVGAVWWAFGYVAMK